jgi:hypothetical protein
VLGQCRTTKDKTDGLTGELTHGALTNVDENKDGQHNLKGFPTTSPQDKQTNEQEDAMVVQSVHAKWGVPINNGNFTQSEPLHIWFTNSSEYEGNKKTRFSHQQTHPVTQLPTIPHSKQYPRPVHSGEILEGQCAHGVRVHDGCQYLSNGESKVYGRGPGKVSGDIQSGESLEVQGAHGVGANNGHQYLSNGESKVSGKGGYQIPIYISRISASSQFPANNDSRSVTVGSNKKMTSPDKASIM